MKCGRERGRNMVEQFGIRPAFPGNGQCCANVTGTFCDLVPGVYAAQYANCEEWDF